MTKSTTWKSLLASSVALAAGLLSAGARAASCSITDISGVSFGSYDVFDLAPLDSTGVLTFVCNGLSQGDALAIALSAGGASSPYSRRMARPGAHLAYNLFLDPARTAVWGDGAGGSALYGPVTPPSGVSQTVIIYGRVPARQNVSVGLYADTVIATILF
jgi:spore coat protein U-like protein